MRPKFTFILVLFEIFIHGEMWEKFLKNTIFVLIVVHSRKKPNPLTKDYVYEIDSPKKQGHFLDGLKNALGIPTFGLFRTTSQGKEGNEWFDKDR